MIWLFRFIKPGTKHGTAFWMFCMTTKGEIDIPLHKIDLKEVYVWAGLTPHTITTYKKSTKEAWTDEEIQEQVKQVMMNKGAA